MFHQLRAALMRLPGESTLLAVGERIDPVSVLASLLPTAVGPLGRNLIARTEQYLHARRLMRRTHFVALRVDGVSGGWRATIGAAVDGVGESFGAGWAPSPTAVRRTDAD